MIHKATIGAEVLAGVGEWLGLLGPTGKLESPTDMDGWTVVPLVAAGVLAIAGLIFLVLRPRRNRTAQSGNEWYAMAIILMVCAIPIGRILTASSLILALVIFVLAILALIRGIRTKTSEQVEAMRRLEGSCIRCGYNLEGNLSGVCPECGVAFDR